MRNEPKKCSGFPIYPKKSVGLMELNVRIKRDGEDAPPAAIDAIRDLLEGEYQLTAWCVEGVYEGCVDLKYEIQNDVAVDLIPDLVYLKYDVPELWGMCSLLVEDEVQVFLLEKCGVPHYNYDYDTMMGDDDR